MARKSRRNADTQEHVITLPMSEKIYKTAIYVRLSIEDIRDRKDSDSIVNQQYMIEKYIEERPFLQLCGVFSDNGETGTNFLRPGFVKLIEACKGKKIECVVVKDLSRLGRNYIETGEYLEKVFPFLGVRFIAIGDGYDSISTKNGLVFGLKNLVNDIYAKDISRKSSTALRMKQKNGQFIGSYAAYGYMKSLDDKNKIVVDEETAPIVRDIFKWKAEGMGQAQICRRLNETGIPSPCKYRYEKGILKVKRYANSDWHPTTLKVILQNPVYLGHMAQGKHNAALYECKAQERSPKSEWVIIEDTHPAIVEKSVFDRVQEIITERTSQYHANAGRYDYFEKPDNLLKGLVYCADCKRPLYRYKSVTCNGKKVTYVFQCRTHTTYLESGCPKKYMHETELAAVVYQLIRMEIEKSADMRSIVERLNGSNRHKDRVSRFDYEIEDLQAKLGRISNLRQSLYEDYAEKLLTEQEYLFAIGKYDTDTENLKQRLSEAVQIKQNYIQNNTTSNKWLAAFVQYTDEMVLTADMAQALIERIEVTNNNEVSVIFKYKDEMKTLCDFTTDAQKAVGE